jgi:HEPN domain-containing protein
MQVEKAEEVRAWLSKADADLRAAEVDLEAEPPLLGDAGFHCQQAVEKALKAFLTAHDSPFRKTHDLDEPAIACGKVDSTLEQEVDVARELTTYAWEFRYPGDAGEPLKEEVQKALEIARGAVRGVESRLPEEAQP